MKENKINPTFIQIETSDGLTLPGLFYQVKKSKKVAIWLHGNGTSSVFYNSDRYFAIAHELNKRGISFLTFNNRGANLIKRINQKIGRKIEKNNFGTAYEKIKDCVIDIDASIKFVNKLNYSEIYLMGHSTGANKICVYNHYKENNIVKKYILAGGGDDGGIYFDMLGKKDFFRLLELSKNKIKSGQGEALIADSALFPSVIFSYQSFFDIAYPDGDYNIFPFNEVISNLKLSTKPLFGYFKDIEKPTLVIYGEKDEYAWGDVNRVVNILKKYQPKFDYKIIKNADHSFYGRELDLAKTIGDWL